MKNMGRGNARAGSEDYSGGEIMKELKPCPFCGAMPKIDSLENSFNGKTEHEILCRAAGCKAHVSTWNYSKEKAIKSWNKRGGRA